MRAAGRALVITVSDRAFRGERADASGPALAASLARLGFAVEGPEVLPDEPEELAAAIRRAADERGLDLVVLTGGTGVGPRDWTPEAVRAVCRREVPGLGEAVRAAGRALDPRADLSRAVAGVRGRTLVVALPGSPRGALEGLAALAPVLGHAVAVAGGADHGPPALAGEVAEPGLALAAGRPGVPPAATPLPAAERAGTAAVPVVAFAGPSGAGKTTLLEEVAARLTARGRRVGFLKHHHGELDAAGKDTWRLRAAGAAVAALAGADGQALLGVRHPPAELARELAAGGGVGLVLAEGFHGGPFPVVLVLPEGMGPEEARALTAASGRPLLAVVGGEPDWVPEGVRHFVRGDAAGVAAYLEKAFPEEGAWPRLAPDCLVCPGAVVVGRVRVGSRASIWYNAVVRGDLEPVTIGREANVQDGAVVHVDEGFPCSIGDRVTVGHRAVVHGCTVGDGSLVGMGAVLLTGARVGEGALVAAGAVVREGQEVPPGCLAAGVPARVLRELTEEERRRVARSAEAYVRLAFGGPAG